jgi:hypothetical protein
MIMVSYEGRKGTVCAAATSALAALKQYGHRFFLI